jgi:cellulose synthase (UDP-forming)
MQNSKNSPDMSPAEFLPLSKGKKILIGVSIVYSICYFIWRGLFTVDTVSYPVYSWLYFIFDAFGFVSSVFFIMATYRIRKRESLKANRVYSVDVFITTINEGVELLRNTASHVLKMDYPHATYLLDDGRRPEVEALAREMGIGYLTRPDNRGAKAGNLNHALSKTEGELVAVFDADGIPRMDFLSKLVGYFNDQKVALVQTPNAFYNLDSFQHWAENSGKNIWHDQALWYDVILRGLDYGNASTWCGSPNPIQSAGVAQNGKSPLLQRSGHSLWLRPQKCGYR